MMARIGRRLFRSTLLGCVAGLLLTVDGLAYVHSRTALLDPLLMFWVLAAFGALLVDRDRARARLADQLDAARTPPRPLGGSGPDSACARGGSRPASPRHGVRHQVERAVVRRRRSA